MKAYDVAGTFLIVIAVLFTAHLSAVMVRRIRAVVLKASYRKVFRYELIVCACFVLCALDFRFGIFTIPGPDVLKAAGRALRVLVILVTAVFLFFMIRIMAAGRVRSQAPARIAVVLGLALENGEPADNLLSRLDTAVHFAEENPDAVLILTGGNPDESGRTEAAVMRSLLAERGIPEDRMILEDRAEDTKENFRNTVQLVSPDEPIVLITSDYHMHRALRTAKNAGFTRVYQQPAPSSRWLYGANVMLEAMMELNELTLRQ